jgi:hypothetical protein
VEQNRHPVPGIGTKGTNRTMKRSS